MNEEELIKRLEVIEKRLDLLEKIPKKEMVIEVGSSDNIFEEHDGKIIVTQTIGDKPKEKAKNIVLLSLLGYKQKLGELEVHTSKLRENVAMHQIPLENFGIWIKELNPQSIIKKGKQGSTKVTYRFTTFGEAKANNLLKEILENETNE